MATLHIENTVHDFDAWKAAFDSYEHFRQANGVRSYRVSRELAQPNTVTVDLDFDTVPDAESFLRSLRKIWETPQSKSLLADSRRPQLLDVVARQTF